MLNKQLYLLILLLFSLNVFGQESLYKAQIDLEISRIDGLDGAINDTVTLISELQTSQATEVYLRVPHEITNRILASTQDKLSKENQLLCLLNILKNVDENNVHFYGAIGAIFRSVKKVQSKTPDKEVLQYLNSNVRASLQLIPFFINRSFAEEFLVAAAGSEPAELLRHFKEYNRIPINDNVIKAVAQTAPMKLRTYLYSSNAVQKATKRNMDPVVMLLYRMVREHVAASKSTVLINDVYVGKITSLQAHEIGKNDEKFLDYLIKMRIQDLKYGVHSVDEALYYQSLKRIRLVNELHDESDAIRFASLKDYDAASLYTLMVYSEDEIFTSTFLGMYKRMMDKMEEESSYQFLYGLGFNKFRVFIKMCSGYNVLTDFLDRMSSFEKQMLFKNLVENLQSANDNLKSAVAVADTYGSMVKLENKMLLEESIVRYYTKIRFSDPGAALLYGTLINVLDIGKGQNLGLSGIDHGAFGVLKSDRIFKDDKHIQQHFFFDDPDGNASYNTFVETFRTGNWVIADKGTYLIIKSARGKKVEIYLNKPSYEYQGQKDIRNHFIETKRWPDVVVHRGHSYFANTAIESLTPNAEIVFLGSCGGYNNINQVLNYAPDAQIISSKQIGTMWVNNKLCYLLNETIRKGEDIVWEQLWEQVDRALGNGSTADQRFNDYIPPHKNMGALLIKTYRNSL